MARKKRTTVEETLPDALVDDMREIAETDLPFDVTSVLDELGDQVSRVTLYRLTGTGRQAYLATIPADEFSLDQVAHQWGGGKYMARLRAVGGAFVKGVAFHIDESVKPDPKPVPPANGGGGIERDVVLKLLEQRNGAGGKDPMEIAAAIAAASGSQAQATMAAMTTAMAPLLAKITELASSRNHGETGIDGLLQAIQLGADLGGHDEGYLGVVKEVGVPLVRALEIELARRKGAPVSLRGPERPGAALTPGGGGPTAEPPRSEAPAGPPWVQALAPFVPKLVDFAVHGGEPSLVAGIIDAQYPRLARWLESAVEQPAFAPAFLRHFPALAPHAAWVQAVLDEFLPDEDETAEPAEESEGAERPGDAPDA